MTNAAESPPKPPDASFSHLRTSKSSHLLNLIERVRANGVGEIVELPQLVVCGDQSAGKSSVLEGITGFQFPRGEGLCTAFPTEIIMRHTENTQAILITARIKPHNCRSEDEKEVLSSYRNQIEKVSELPAIIRDVSRLLHIRGFTEEADACTFASDILVIEVTGPLGLHLSVVDVPGLISVASEKQTEEDIETVHDIVTSYLQSSRTIILSVLQANNDMANQGIIKLARKHDPEGQRTVGIITKPDLINEGSEANIARVAKNQDAIKLKLGFFLLKNPTPSEIEEGLDMATRSKRELRFFSAPAWASQNLDQDRIGADKLRTYLQDLLDTHIERELPKVREEIRRSLSQIETELRSLGDARPSLQQIRAFMTNLSMKFYQLVQAALDGNYYSIDVEFFSEYEGSRLRARIQEVNTKFAAHMRTHGKTRRIGTHSQSSSLDHELANETTQLTTYYRNKGRELPGNHNWALLSELHQEQSRRWKGIAEEHVCDVLQMASQWTQDAVKRLIHEEAVQSEVEGILRERLENAKKLALDELEQLVDDERKSPLTYNHYYTDNVQQDRLNAQRAAIKDAIHLVTDQDWARKSHISNRPKDIERFVHSLQDRITVDMDEQACNEAMAQLNAYYKVAMKTFVDNVARQVIERHIVDPLPKAFYPNSVARLSDDEILRIGAEPEHQSARRAKLGSMAEGLRQSLVALQKSRP